MKIFCVALFCTLLICGCSSTYTVGPKETGADYEITELNAHLENQSVKIILNNEDERKGIGVVCLRDSISWRESLTTIVERTVPRSQVYVVERTYDQSAAVVSLTSGEQVLAEGVVVTNDSVSWKRPTTVTAKVTLPTSQIKRIVLTNRPLGLLEGAGCGLLTGGVAGILVPAILVGKTDATSGAGVVYVLGPAIGCGAGLLAGTVIGLAKGHSYEYEFTTQSEKP